MNDAAESNCILPIGDDGSLNGGCSSSELIIIEINSESEFQQLADWNGVINQVKKLCHVVSVIFLGRYLIGVLECHQLTPPNKFVLFLANPNCVHRPPSYHHRRYLHCTISLIMKKNSVT